MNKILNFLFPKKAEEVDSSPNPCLVLAEVERNLLHRLMTMQGEGNIAVYSLRMCWQNRKDKLSSEELVLMTRITQLFGIKDWMPAMDNHPYVECENQKAYEIITEAKKQLQRLGYNF